jgi:hypothetical protein
MSLIGHMVTRNEIGRYLPDTVAWLAELTDNRLLVYDDQSTDGTAEYISSTCRLPLAVRPDDVPTFASDESAFRQAAWRTMERAFQPSTDDWILSIDADEFLVTAEPGQTVEDVRVALDRAMSIPDATSVTFAVAEVFGVNDENWPMLRTDGYWDCIQACRLVKWRPGGTFHPRKEGGGSVPSAWPKPMFKNTDMALLHYGYTTPEDRSSKYLRYRFGGGHNPVHIASIQRAPRLTKWTGMAPPFGHIRPT